MILQGKLSLTRNKKGNMTTEPIKLRFLLKTQLCSFKIEIILHTQKVTGG